MKKGTIALFGFVGTTLIAGLLLSGCISLSTQGSRIEDSLIAKIEKGKTTKAEILKCFGAPDQIIQTGITAEAKTAIEGDKNLTSQQNVSIGKNQEVYIYEYVENRTTKNIYEVRFGTGPGATISKKNTLMIWIDKDTGIVQDYGYKKEI